jgi:serine/threonine protein kinase
VLPLVLALAHDVACAMLHLHHENVVHSDLKAGNVLLTRANMPPAAHALGLARAGDAPDAAAATAAADGDGSGSGSGLQLQPGSCAALLAAQQAATGGRLVARVADFGLSLYQDPASTHISHMHAGTATHMAPELLLHGRASKASDVYAFGVLMVSAGVGLQGGVAAAASGGVPAHAAGLDVSQPASHVWTCLVCCGTAAGQARCSVYAHVVPCPGPQWEMATGKHAFHGMPVALLGYSVTQLALRPAWVPGVSPALRQLTEQCWAQEPAQR